MGFALVSMRLREKVFFEEKVSKSHFLLKIST